MPVSTVRTGVLLVVGACHLSSCGSLNLNVAVKPVFLRGDIVETAFDGVTDDLLTAGLGVSGLANATAPAFVNAESPTSAELRRNAIHSNYRAQIDPTAAGGFGRLYGPNIDIDGNDTLGNGKIAGSEHIAIADDGTGKQNVVLMVQVPASFDPNAACIVTAASPGSRGIYGAIATAGEWGLKHGCAVAYTDKGTGNGIHDLGSDKVLKIDGTRADASSAGIQGLFRTELTQGARQNFNANFPNRIAYKHAHSMQQPERLWGTHTLQSIKLALYVLNQKFGDRAIGNPGAHLIRYTAANTLVIASSTDNGAGAALAAAEQDSENLIDGVAIAQPNAQPASTGNLVIRQGASTVSTHSKALVDYVSLVNLFQPCAALSTQSGLSLSSALWPASYTSAAQNRCAALRGRGLLSAATPSGQADEALAKIRAYGWQSEHDFLHQSHFRFATNAVLVTQLNALGRFSVSDNLCGFSFANTDSAGNVAAQVSATQAGLFASGSGMPPGAGIDIVYNLSSGGAKLDFLAVSPVSNSADFALDGALCLRSLVTGQDLAGNNLTGTLKEQADRVAAGLREIQLSANLQRKPAVIVAGRSDALIPVNHAARAYFGKNQLAEGSLSKLRYYEITNAQHFDSFIGMGTELGYENRFIPLHVYYLRAMDLMWRHLKSGSALPASQIVKTTPRGMGVSLSTSHVPAIAAVPVTADAITFSGASLFVPE